MERYTLHSKTEEYLRRCDKNSGQIESICLRCFETIARAADLHAIERFERQHDCPARFHAKSASA